MKEFLLPDLPQWLPEYQSIPWEIDMGDKHELSHPAGVYSHLSPLVRDILERSPRLLRTISRCFISEHISFA